MGMLEQLRDELLDALSRQRDCGHCHSLWVSRSERLALKERVEKLEADAKEVEVRLTAARLEVACVKRERDKACLEFVGEHNRAELAERQLRALREAVQGILGAADPFRKAAERIPRDWAVADTAPFQCVYAMTTAQWLDLAYACGVVEEALR